MRTLRTSRPLRCLALAALCLELVLAFAHVHAPARPFTGLALACRTMFLPGTDQRCPPVRHTHGDECSICIALAQAQTGVVPEPPALPDINVLRVRLAPAPTLLPARTVPLYAFRARAPPASAV